ncbi:hypothetical protein DERP_000280 [Dermatophagoides pteronyssinus]|uniref:Uncharacterized protein n=1 Tax=Dermatophagoides pteronyssinus TaxID=6956 RepID=A0ABQ8IZT1_DERPT|nr:hypothetical protein DERP_000280 [Dermatophagoides pteronyssinus]
MLLGDTYNRRTSNGNVCGTYDNPRCEQSTNLIYTHIIMLAKKKISKALEHLTTTISRNLINS